jgi:acyl-CoA synthetase (AMP-forming)/AMP-acid ligase II
MADLELEHAPSALTLPALLNDVSRRFPEREAMRFEWRAITYRDLHARARRCAAGLIEAWVAKGTPVALLMANRPEWVISAFAVSLAGGVLVPLSTFATHDERDHLLRHSDASVLLFQRTLLKRDFLEELRSLAPRCLENSFCFGLGQEVGTIQPWEALIREADLDPVDTRTAQVGADDVGVLLYTSGTSADPKGVLHFQRAPVIQSYRSAEYLRLGPEDRVLTSQPFFWAAGFATSLGGTLAAGATLLLQETFEPNAALDIIERERATCLLAWPHQEKAMATHPTAASRDLKSLRKLNFSSALAPLVGLASDDWGKQGGYGLSETFTVACNLVADAPAELRRTTNGRPLPGTEVRVVDPASGAPRPPGVEGEIYVRGATLMRGYHKGGTGSDAEGWFHTEDSGWFDEAGYLHWTGRLSNLIKTGGANVAPLEVERALAAREDFRHAAVVGVPHPTLGEVVVLCAIPRDGARIDGEEIQHYLRTRLASYKVPRAVLLFTDQELGYTGNQKLRLPAVRRAAQKRLEETHAEISGFRYESF